MEDPSRLAVVGLILSAMSSALCCCSVLLCQRCDPVCRSLWTAASASQQRRRANQDITGRSVATDARHGGPLVAANLIGTGERYGYAFALVLELLQRPGGLRQLHIDIMCKWQPWSEKVLQALIANPAVAPDLKSRVQELRAAFLAVRKVNAAAHGNLHAQHCQVGRLCAATCAGYLCTDSYCQLALRKSCVVHWNLCCKTLCVIECCCMCSVNRCKQCLLRPCLQVLFQPSWNKGCAKTVGEEGEQLFSYLSRLSLTTRNMSRAGELASYPHEASEPGKLYATPYWPVLTLILPSAGSTDAITEAAMHYARLKNAGQAAYLAKRWRRFTAQLPAAQARLEELLAKLDRTPVTGRQEFVQSAKAQLQHMAQCECNSL